MFAALTEELVTGPDAHDEFELTLSVHPLADTGKSGRYASQAMIVTTAARRIIELSKDGAKVKTILIDAPEGQDPMVHPEFRDIAQNLRELTDKWFPKSKLTVVSPALHLDDPERRISLTAFHRPILLFEAGTQKTFAALTDQDPQRFKDVCTAIEQIDMERWILRACFVRGDVDNSTDTELRYWLSKVETFKPAHIQITTLPKADTKRKIKPVTATRLNAIAEKIAKKTEREVEILEAK